MKRLESIDAIRTVAILMVICIHTNPFSTLGGFYSGLASTLEYLYPFPVPFFFVASGYFFGKRLQRGEDVVDVFRTYAKHLLLIFILWSIFYILIPSTSEVIAHGFMKSVSWNMASSIKLAYNNPVTFMLQGTSSHLWFLTSLIYGMAVLTLHIKHDMELILFPVALFLLCVGLLGGAYSFLPIGYVPSFNTREGPFFSTLCVTYGWWLSRCGIKNMLALGVLITIGGLFLELLEHGFISAHVAAIDHTSMLLGSLPFGAGIFMMALALPQLGKNTVLPALGKLTLGVYLCHWMIINALMPIRFFYRGPIWEITFPLLVYALSLGLTAMLLRWRYTAKLL